MANICDPMKKFFNSDHSFLNVSAEVIDLRDRLPCCSKERIWIVRKSYMLIFRPTKLKE